MVDIIIPTYKARETLPAALDSLVAQTKKMFIVTIVQDCDGEDYTDIVKEYRRRGLQVRLIQTEKNGGPGAARQLGMDSDKLSEFFMFMDADDILNPRAVEILSREIKLHNADLATSDFLVNEKADVPSYMSVDTTPCTWCHGKIYRAKYLRDNNIRFFPGLRLNEDSYFNLVATNCTKKRIKIHEVTYIWNQQNNSLTHKDGIIGFHVKSWEQYIFSQVQGLIDIVERNGEIDPALVAATLINVYTHHMKALCSNVAPLCKVEDFKDASEELKRLSECPEVAAALKSKEFWGYLCDNLKASEMFDGNLVFYKMRFCDWMKEYLWEKIG